MTAFQRPVCSQTGRFYTENSDNSFITPAKG